MPDFKLGKLPGRIPVGLRDLTFYAAGPLPQAPASVAVPSVADWNMDMNDTLGCCGVAGVDHGSRLRQPTRRRPRVSRPRSRSETTT